MEASKQTKFRFLLGNCIAGRAECSASQMRGGFVLLNFLAWVIILASIKFLT
jgi:hypothetical protein